jgi:hypothetical protein
MTAGKIIAYLAAAILIFFGVLFIWGAFSPQGQTGWIIIGLLTVGVGFAIIWFAARRKASEAAGENVTLKIDLPSDVSMDTLRCQNCGGALKPEDIKMVAGAPVVTCPYCGTTYQLKEEPKW